MRIYRDCFEMYSEEKRNLHEMGTIVWPSTMQDKEVGDNEDYRTLELSPCAFQIRDGSTRNQWIKELGLSLEWCQDDFIERISGRTGVGPVNPGEAWKLRRDTWSEFMHDGKFSYTYSERLATHAHRDSSVFHPILQAVVERLITDPGTRHGIIPIFSAEKDGPNLDGKHRIPCSMFYQFLIRRNELHAIYTMRSTDFVTHFPYDIWHALELQDFIAWKVGKKNGPLTFFSGSLHIYAKDVDDGVF